MVSDEIIEQVLDLQENGFSYREIAEELKKKGVKIGKTTVSRICSSEDETDPTFLGDNTEKTSNEKALDVEIEDDKMIDSILDSDEDPEEPQVRLDRFGREVLQMSGETISRKICFNPKTLLQFAFFKKRFGWEGDLSDFVADTIQYFIDHCVGEDIVFQPVQQQEEPPFFY